MLTRVLLQLKMVITVITVLVSNCMCWLPNFRACYMIFWTWYIKQGNKLVCYLLLTKPLQRCQWKRWSYCNMYHVVKKKTVVWLMLQWIYCIIILFIVWGSKECRLLQRGCHICINNEMKVLSSDVKVEFSLCAKTVASLTRFFEMHHQEVLWHVVTRWLSLLPAVERILHSWHAPRSNFLSREGEQCKRVLWRTCSTGFSLYSVHIFYTIILRSVMHLNHTGYCWPLHQTDEEEAAWILLAHCESVLRYDTALNQQVKQKVSAWNRNYRLHSCKDTNRGKQVLVSTRWWEMR